MITGDIIMVSRDMKDKETRKPYTWKWLGVVMRVGKRGRSVKLLRLGAYPPDDVVSIILEDDRWDIRVIPEEHWPDGARVLRMRAIMEGRVEGLI